MLIDRLTNILTYNREAEYSSNMDAICMADRVNLPRLLKMFTSKEVPDFMGDFDTSESGIRDAWPLFARFPEVRQRFTWTASAHEQKPRFYST